MELTATIPNPGPREDVSGPAGSVGPGKESGIVLKDLAGLLARHGSLTPIDRRYPPVRAPDAIRPPEKGNVPQGRLFI